MADSNSSSRSTAQDFCGMLSLASVCRACKSFVTSKKQPAEKNSPKAEPQEEEITHIDRIRKASEEENQKKKTLSSPSLRYNGNNTSTSTSGGGLFNNYPSTLSRSASTTESRNGPSPLSRSTSQRSQAHTRSGPIATLLKSISKKNVDPTPTVPSSLSRTTSRSGPMPIMYSNSTGLVRPPAMEKQLECTLDELCLGCTKKVTITRDVVKDNGQIVQEDEELTIKVKPGWTKGTKIKFEGMGNETPGTKAADLNFVVAEKKHHLFRREGDNLKLAIEVPLIKALTGCTLSIPLVGGEKTSVKIDDIVYPGYEKIIEGQGMPMAKEKGERGNLIVKFQVQFPEKLTDEQRSDVYRILQSSFDQGNCSP